MNTIVNCFYINRVILVHIIIYTLNFYRNTFCMIDQNTIPFLLYERLNNGEFFFIVYQNYHKVNNVNI